MPSFVALTMPGVWGCGVVGYLSAVVREGGGGGMGGSHSLLPLTCRLLSVDLCPSM